MKSHYGDAGFEHYGGEDEALEESTNRVMMVGFGLMLAFFLVFPLYRFFEPANREEARETHLNSLAAEGEEIWGFNCSACHGIAGEGGIGPTLNAKEFLQATTDEQLSTFVAVGVPGTQMAAFSQDFSGPLTTAQIRAVATYIRSWEEDAPSIPEWREGLPVAGDTSDVSDGES